MTTTIRRTGRGADARTRRWRTRDIVVTAVIGVAFGVAFVARRRAVGGARRPGPAPEPRLRRLAAAGRSSRRSSSASPAPRCSPRSSRPALSALLGQRLGRRHAAVRRSIQGAAAELVFAVTRYRSYGPGHAGAAGLASAAAAFVHDVVVYYSGYATDVLLLIALWMADLRRDPPADRGHRPRPRAALDRRPGRVPRLTAHRGPRRRVHLRRGRPARPCATWTWTSRPARACSSSGRPGSGKSTFALALAGLVPREVPGTWTGSLTVDGDDRDRSRRARSPPRVGLVFQDPARQLVMDRVEDDVAFGLENLAWRTAGDDRARARSRSAPSGLAGGSPAHRRRCRAGSGSGSRWPARSRREPASSSSTSRRPTWTPTGRARSWPSLDAATRRTDRTIVLIEHRVDAAWPLADLVLALDGPDGRWRSARPRTVLRAPGRAGRGGHLAAR